MRMLAAVLLLAFAARAQDPILHPEIQLLDRDGDSVLARNGALSTRMTCGKCHDTAYIEEHCYHQNDVDRWDPIRYGVPALRRRVGGDAFGEFDELNCFLCHLAEPDLAARNAALRGRWRITATLGRTPWVKKTDDGWEFTLGFVKPQFKKPTARHCGACHGPVHMGDAPFVYKSFESPRGTVFSPQRLRDSGMNLRGKESLAFAFDVHAERLLTCAHCHHAPNNPAYVTGTESTRPAHLAFDARRLAIREYLSQPSHDFARGEDMRSCEDCHRVEESHAWLPHFERHAAAMRCEACHISRVWAPARSLTDWSLLTPEGGARVEYRGVEGAVDDPASLVTGYRPVLLPGEDGRLAPHNEMVVRYWTSGDQPVPLDVLRHALGDAADVDVARERLLAAGVEDVRLHERVERYPLHHGVVTHGVRECTECHATDSRITAGSTGVYVLGHHRSAVIDWIGLVAVAGVLLGALVHGALRWGRR